MAAFYNDVSIPFGSITAAFTRTGTGALGTYVLENITVTRPGRIIKRYDEIGQPNGSVGVKDFDTMSATAQMATSASNMLQRGDQFAVTLDSAIGSETWFVTDVDQPLMQNDYWKFSIKLIKKYN